MIERLLIRDLVVIERLDLELGPGLNVVSGGSGEGKSLVLDALRFLLGEGGGKAAARRLVRPGAPAARVEADLDLRALGAARRRALVAACPELEAAGAGTVRLARVLDRAGRTKAAVGEAAVGVSALRRLGRALLEVFGQGEAPRLLEEARQRAFVDAAGGLGEAVDAYAAARARALELARERDRLLAEERRRVAEEERLTALHEELAALDPGPGEHAELEERLVALEGAGERRRTLGALVDRLEEGEGALLDGLREAAQTLDRLQPTPGGAAAREALEAGLVDLEEAVAALVRERDDAEEDPRALSRTRERLGRFREVGRRVGLPPEALAARWEELAAAEPAAALAARRAGVERELRAGVGRLAADAAALSAARAEAATRLTREVARGLPELGLGEATFACAVADEVAEPSAGADLAGEWDGVERLEDALLARHPAAHGRDRVRFLFSGNAGHEPAPLERASGGELSRLLLVLGRRQAERAGAPVLVFDEVDQNVGARLGGAVGACLREIAAGRQLLAVTHLAPVAAQAHRHLRIEKTAGASEARRLEGEARVEELALMIKGHPVTPAAREQARELLAEAAPEPPRTKRGRKKKSRPRRTRRLSA